MIRTGFTMTSEGEIAHLFVTTDKYGQLRLPVRITEALRDLNNRPFPERDSGGDLRYAWPGGGSITEKGVICLSNVYVTSAES